MFWVMHVQRMSHQTPEGPAGRGHQRALLCGPVREEATGSAPMTRTGQWPEQDCGLDRQGGGAAWAPLFLGRASHARCDALSPPRTLCCDTVGAKRFPSGIRCGAKRMRSGRPPPVPRQGDTGGAGGLGLWVLGPASPEVPVEPKGTAGRLPFLSVFVPFRGNGSHAVSGTRWFYF